MIFNIGTSCPPSPTRLATREALIWGLSVPMKNRRIKKPQSFALRTNANLSGAESTVSKIRLCFSFRQRSRHSAAYRAAFMTASCEFQSPNRSRAIRSGLIYSQPSIHWCFRILPVTEVFPDPFGPATISNLGFCYP